MKDDKLIEIRINYYLFDFSKQLNKKKRLSTSVSPK